MSSNRISPNQREILSAQSTVTGKQEYLTSTNGALNTTGGGSGGGGAVTIADGANIVEGTTTDAKVLGDSPGTISAKLRGINTALAGNIAVTGTFFQATQPVSLAINTPTLQSGSTTTVTQATGSNLHTVIDSGTISLPTGASTSANQTTEITSLSSIVTNTTGLSTLANQTNGTQQTKITNGTTTASIDAEGNLGVSQKAPTATLTNVSASASSVTLLSANTARIGATITNDSSAVVYIKFGTTASTTSYTVSLAGAASAPFSYYEVPAGYTGRIDAISASATGTLRITEIS